jgi:hypothetical protein
MTRKSLANPWVASIILLSLWTAGCAKEPTLTTYSVDGRVFYRGGKPVTAGQIRFTPVEDSSFTVAGDIGADGTFSLRTVKDRESATGAIEGTYRVTIQLPSVEHRYVPEIVLPRPYKVEAKDNHFEIEIEAPKVRR